MVNPLQFTQPQAYSGGADFSPLANLYDVYKASQQRAMQEAALAKLGPDLNANSQALISSGVPGLASLGLNLQQSALNRQREDAQQAIVNARMAEAEKRAGAHLTIAQQAAQRQQEAYDKQAADEADAAKIMAGLGGRGAAPPQSPFPAPIPGAPPQGAAPPVVAGGEGTEPGLPSWANPVTARITTNLVSNQPAAAADISRDQIAELYRNPITRPLAEAYLKKQTDPGAWSYHFDDVNQRVVATNAKTNEVKDVTPGGQTGQPPITKEQRERDLRYVDAIKRGYNEGTANYYALNNKLPKEDLSATELKMIDANDNIYHSASQALDNITRLEGLSKKAFQGYGASALGAVTSQFGEGAGSATVEYNNIALRNVIAMVKSAFPRPTEYETKLMQRIETGTDMPQKVRDDLLADLRKQLTLRANEAEAKSEAIRNKTYGKPGGITPTPLPGTAEATAAALTAPAATGAKPSLSDFMTKARTANPGVPDSELANYWKSKYGGK